jgi:hypothetical protein
MPMAMKKIKKTLPNSIKSTFSMPQNSLPAKPHLTGALVISDYSHNG